MTATTNRPGPLFWIISTVALVWNLLGVAMFTMQLTMSDETRAQLPELERTMYANIPSWYMVAFGIAVFAGALGCVALRYAKNGHSSCLPSHLLRYFCSKFTCSC